MKSELRTTHHALQTSNSSLSSQTVVQATIILTIGILFCRILGFVREMVIAHIFGATAETDAFLIALIIPNLFAGLMANAITFAFIPVFTEYRVKQGDQDAWRITSTLINLTLVVLVIGTIVVFLTAPFIVRLIGPGLAKETQTIAIQLTRVMSPAIIFLGLIGLSTAILNSYKHFIVPAFAGLLYNTAIIGGALFLTRYHGTTGLAIGVVIGGLGHLLTQSIILVKKRGYYTLSLHLNHPGVKQIFLLVLPFLVGSITSQLNLIVDRILASGLVEGSIAALNFAVRVMGLPLSIFGIAIGVAVYPTLSQQAVEGRLDRLRNTFSEGVRMLWFITVPATVGLIVLREPIIRLLFERGAFDAAATSMTASVLLFYSLGLFAHAGNVILIRTYFSMQDTKMPVKLGVLAVALNIVLNLILVRYMGANGLALASSIAAGAHFVLLVYYLRQKLGHLDGGRIIWSSAKIVLASLVMGVVCWLALDLSRPLFADVMPLMQQLIQIGGLIIAGGISYLTMAALLRMEELGKIGRLRHIFRQR
ncbi:murein biosynthesis integral membrane protein MurJ [Candidatus Acetothermia bacterium]|nr:murein biosynthesis integral membrane protein MurJ [Candidatus Acetothermia bacterium]